MPHMPSIQDNNTHALLIGVDDYRSFNGTTDFDLKGSRNDVLLLASYCVEVLGLRPENIVALTWPQLTEQDFEQHVSMRWGVLGDAVRGIVVGDAKEEEVTKRLAALLHFSQGGTALLTFSGHGAAVTDSPVLCLGDTAPGFKSGVLPLKTLRDDIKKASAERRLIALLDCCHVAVPPHAQKLQGTSLPHTVAPEDVMKQEDLFRVSDRVLLAARPGMEAYQMRLGTLWHGALTFALVTAAERWQGKDQASLGSYKHVLKRAKATLKALGVRQKSELRMPPEKRDEIRQSPFLGVKPGNTVPKPDAPEVGAQLPSDWIYTIYLGTTSDSPVLAQALVPVLAPGIGSACLSWPDGQTSQVGTDGTLELWFVNSLQVESVRSATDIFIQRRSITGLGSSRVTPIMMNANVSRSLSFFSSSLGNWQPRLLAPLGGNNTLFKCPAPGGPAGSTAYLRFNTSGTAGSDPAHVQWFLTGLTARPTDFDPAGGYRGGTTDSTDSLWGASSR